MSTTHRVAPWWVGYLLLAPWRRWYHDPRKMLAPHLAAGHTVLEVGPGMGFFTLALARMVGPAGQVIAIDCQERMLDGLRRRTRRAGVSGLVEARLSTETSLQVNDLRGSADLVVAINVLHEAAAPEVMIAEMVGSLRPGGRLYLSEPRGHVKEAEFAREVELARVAGLVVVARPRVWRQLTAVLETQCRP